MTGRSPRPNARLPEPGVSRPCELIAVVGTATEVGKTWAAVELVSVLRQRGLTVAVRKPVQSFDPNDSSPTDAARLGGATKEDAMTVCPSHRWYPTAMAPPMAADELGRDAIRLDDLVAELTWPDGIDVGLVETAGGIRSPIAHDADCAQYVAAIGADRVLLVADAGLGALSDVRLAAHCLSETPVTVLLNRYDESTRVHVLNRRWLAERDGLDVITKCVDWVSRR